MVVKNRAESNSSHLFPDYSQQIADRDDNNMTPGPYTPRRLTISALLTHNSQYALYSGRVADASTPPLDAAPPCQADTPGATGVPTTRRERWSV